MRIQNANSPSSVLHYRQSEWLAIVDTVEYIYDILDKETLDNLRHGYGQTIGYPIIDKLATALEQFLEDNDSMERVYIDSYLTVEVKRVKDFISFIRLAQEIQVR